MEIKWCEFKSVIDSRGSLVIVEGSGINIPFDVKRVYYIFDNKDNERRGFHAHKDLLQVAVVIKGSCKFMLDNGKEKAEVLLDRPDRGLFINKMTWREMFDFSDDCMLMVFASEHYDADDYIKDYEEFRGLI